MKSRKILLLLLILIPLLGCNPVKIKPDTIHFNLDENLKTFEVSDRNITNSKVAVTITPSKLWLEVAPTEFILEKGDSITVQVYLNSLNSHTKNIYTDFVMTDVGNYPEPQSFTKDTILNIPITNPSQTESGATDSTTDSTTDINTILRAINLFILALQNLSDVFHQLENPYPEFATAYIYIKSFFGTNTLNITTTPNYFTEEFYGDIDLAYKSLTFVPDESINFYKLTTSDITNFSNPTDGANIINFTSPDEPFKLELTDEKKVLYYGKSYETIYISGYGWIGLGKPRKNSKPQYTELSEELPNYFYSSQISVFPTNQSDGRGTVSYLQLQNKLVISYENISTYQNEQGETKNSFQIELFYNGKININYLNLDSTARGIIGLSFGSGKQFVPPGYMESDLVPSSN
ncbi:MAG TPA: hypothetical protein PLX23_05360 [Candidatus Hydrogenedens sp.]|nr:hypothetical protein [Candidatus Hydrogenedens sp.]